MPSYAVARVTFKTMIEAINMLAPFHSDGRAYVDLPEAQADGPDLLRVVSANDPRVAHFLMMAFHDVNGELPKDGAEIRKWVALIQGLALRTHREQTPPAKEGVLFCVVCSYIRAVRDVEKQPHDMHAALVAHAKRFGLLQPGDELPASEDALTGMLHKLTKRLADNGVIIDSGKKGRRFIRIRLASPPAQVAADEPAPDTPTPPDTSDGPEVSTATTIASGLSATRDTSETEFALARLRDRRKENHAH